MSVTAPEKAGRKSVTLSVCSRCECPSRTYTEGCLTCQNRQRQHRRREKQRSEKAKAKAGTLFVISSGNGVGRLVWRTPDRCKGSSIDRMLDGIRNRCGDPDIDILREIPCTMDQGYTIVEAAATILDEYRGEPVRYHDLESVRDQIDALRPVRKAPALKHDAFLSHWTCEYDGRSYVLTPMGGRWMLSCASTGEVVQSTPALVSSDRRALTWARLAIGSGWPKAQG